MTEYYRTLLSLHYLLPIPLQKIPGGPDCKRKPPCPWVTCQMLLVQRNEVVDLYLHSLGQHLRIRQVVHSG